MEHEGQRNVAELGTILWHAMEGQRDAPELEAWMAPPHADPIVALAPSRRRLAEYAVPEAIDRSCAFPGARVWLIEIERAKGVSAASGPPSYRGGDRIFHSALGVASLSIVTVVTVDMGIVSLLRVWHCL